MKSVYLRCFNMYKLRKVSKMKRMKKRNKRREQQLFIPLRLRVEDFGGVAWSRQQSKKRDYRKSTEN